MKFRDLTADDIEVRVQSVSKNGNGVVLLLYKNARVDMAILDETVGAENWQREHYECKGNLFCRVGIRVTKGVASTGITPLTTGTNESNTATNFVYDFDTWVWKSDCGVESNTEAQKGEASDSFKRACFNWGIGRELYTAPLIWVPASKCNINNGKCYDRFVVEKIVIENKRISALSIINTNIKSDKISEKRAFVMLPEAKQ